MQGKHIISMMHIVCMFITIGPMKKLSAGGERGKYLAHQITSSYHIIISHHHIKNPIFFDLSLLCQDRDHINTFCRTLHHHHRALSHHLDDASGSSKIYIFFDLSLLCQERDHINTFYHIISHQPQFSLERPLLAYLAHAGLQRLPLFIVPFDRDLLPFSFLVLGKAKETVETRSPLSPWRRC